jgi:AcrR family transcriptional regulator
MASTPAANGQARRRARTRAALLTAARELLAEGREGASIDEITKRAGVGFGSFFNHFPEGKPELFEEAVLELLDGYSLWVRSATDGLDDPAEIFARSFRLTGRLVASQPELLAPLVPRGLSLLFLERGLREAALADLADGVRRGRFLPIDPEVQIVSVGSVLLGLVHLESRRPGALDDATIDAVAASVLRQLGLSDAEAEALVARPLPELPELGT